jgi:hypothetical protein
VSEGMLLFSRAIFKQSKTRQIQKGRDIIYRERGKEVHHNMTNKRPIRQDQNKTKTRPNTRRRQDEDKTKTRPRQDQDKTKTRHHKRCWVGVDQQVSRVLVWFGWVLAQFLKQQQRKEREDKTEDVFLSVLVCNTL